MFDFFLYICKRVPIEIWSEVDFDLKPETIENETIKNDHFVFVEYMRSEKGINREYVPKKITRESHPSKF